jgi:hypothetical protein
VLATRSKGVMVSPAATSLPGARAATSRAISIPTTVLCIALWPSDSRLSLRGIPGRRIIQKEAPQAENLRGAFLEVVSFVQAFSSVAGLLRGARGYERAGIDDGKLLSIVTALKIERLLLDGVDMNHLAWSQANPNAYR